MMTILNIVVVMLEHQLRFNQKPMLKVSQKFNER